MCLMGEIEGGNTDSHRWWPEFRREGGVGGLGGQEASGSGLCTPCRRWGIKAKTLLV